MKKKKNTHGGHRVGYSFGVPRSEQTSIHVPKCIKDDVKDLIIMYWEENKHKYSQEK